MKPQLESLSTSRNEYAVYLDGQLIGWIAKVSAKLWQVVGMGEQWCPMSLSSKSKAVKMLVDASRSK